MRHFFLTGVICLFTTTILAQTPDFLHESPEKREARMAWWKQGRFGLFLHWGAYSVAAGEYNGQKNYGEWLMYEAKIPKPEYEQLADQFNPVQFDAEAWVKAAKDAGMKYIVITSKHHDGFCMFDSKLTDYDIVDRTVFRRDPMRELANACKKYHMRLCFYHSIMDWHHPDATGERFPKYREEYLKPQLKELLTKYGDIGVLWFDGEWIDEWTEEQGRDLYSYVRSLQPNIIINNRVGKGRNGMQGMNQTDDAVGDFGTPEQEILAESTGLPWESCMTMNDHWGYNRNDRHFKSAAVTIWNLADIVAKGGNYLLNIGPTAEGLFPPECLDNLRDMGAWTHRNAEAVYGSKPWTHWQEGDDIRYAAGREGSIFVFVKSLPERRLLLKKIKATPGFDITILGEKQPLTWRQEEDGLVIDLPENINSKDQPVWVFKCFGTPANISKAPQIQTATKGVKNSGKGLRQAFVFRSKVSAELTADPGAAIYYSTDGSAPTKASKKYAGPFPVTESTVVKAMAVEPGKVSSDQTTGYFTKAPMGLTLHTAYAEKYGASGDISLLDGLRGSTRFTDGLWLGYEGVDFSATLDLGKQTAIQSVGAHFLRLIPSWIFLPTDLRVEISSDGRKFREVGALTLPEAKDTDADETREITVPCASKGRFIRMTAKNIGKCPGWHPGANGKAWIFIDEIWVNRG